MYHQSHGICSRLHALCYWHFWKLAIEGWSDNVSIMNSIWNIAGNKIRDQQRFWFFHGSFTLMNTILKPKLNHQEANVGCNRTTPWLHDFNVTAIKLLKTFSLYLKYIFPEILNYTSGNYFFKPGFTGITEVLHVVEWNMKISWAFVNHGPYFRHFTQNPFRKPIGFGTMLTRSATMLTCFLVLDYNKS